MKFKRKTIVMAIAAVFTIAMNACSGDDDTYFSKDDTILSEGKDASLNDIINTSWKCYGYGSKKGIREVKPSVNPDAYVINFKDDGIVTGSTFANDFWGEYIVQGSNISIKIVGTTKVGELGDGEEYSSALKSCSQFTPFKISDDKLLIYYNNKQSYLLFNSIDSQK